MNPGKGGHLSRMAQGNAFRYDEGIAVWAVLRGFTPSILKIPKKLRLFQKTF
jgi:hypothetical protein